MSHRITADWTSLMRQASSTASTYFGQAMSDLKEQFEDEFEDISITERFSMAMRLAEMAERDFRMSSFGVAAQNLGDTLELLADRFGHDQ